MGKDGKDSRKKTISKNSLKKDEKRLVNSLSLKLNKGIKLNKINTELEYYKKLKEILLDREGFYSHFYKDTQGCLTIGIGTAVQNTNGWISNGAIEKRFRQPSPEETAKVAKIMEIDEKNLDLRFKIVLKNRDMILTNRATYTITKPQAVLLMYRELSKTELKARNIATAERWDLEPYSKEMLALHSMIYNMGANMPSTQKYIADGSRVGAWFEIRYRSNKNRTSGKGEGGLFLRRFQESNIFQLFDNLYFDNENFLFKRDRENKVNIAISKVKYDKGKKRWTIEDKSNENILRKYLNTDKGNKVSIKEAEFILGFFNSLIEVKEEKKVKGKKVVKVEKVEVGKIMQDYEKLFESWKKDKYHNHRVMEASLNIEEIVAFVYLKTGKSMVVKMDENLKKN